MQNSQNSPVELLGARAHLFVRAGRRGKTNWVPVLVPLGFCGSCLPACGSRLPFVLQEEIAAPCSSTKGLKRDLCCGNPTQESSR